MPRKRLTSTKKHLLRLGIKVAFETIGAAFLGVAAAHENGRIFRRGAIRQWKRLGYDLRSIQNCLWRLKHFGYIQEFVEGKAGYLELTAKGRARVQRYGLTRTFIRPRRWDGKWRILIYDVPEEEKKKRQQLKYHLDMIGFIPIQKSVFIFPFECTPEVRAMLRMLALDGRAVLFIAETLDGEEYLIKECVSRGILSKEHVRQSTHRDRR